jgi:hypothetical protein
MGDSILETCQKPDQFQMSVPDLNCDLTEKQPVLNLNVIRRTTSTNYGFEVAEFVIAASFFNLFSLKLGSSYLTSE